MGWGGCLTVGNRVGGAVESAPDLVVMRTTLLASHTSAFSECICARVHPLAYQPSANGLLLLAYHD